MTPTIISVAILMVGVAGASIAWLQGYRVAVSARRTTAMMTRVGLDSGPPTLAAPRTKAIMKKVRQRCMRCPHEDLCDRWLAGAVGGGNTFCPNAQTFGILRGTNVGTG